MNTDNRTDEELNCIIAERCKWAPTYGDHALRTAWLDITGQDIGLRAPNYCKDLQAIHNAVMTLDPHYHWAYGDHIRSITGCLGPNGEDIGLSGFGVFTIAHASARERAEALVRVLEEIDK